MTTEEIERSKKIKPGDLFSLSQSQTRNEQNIQCYSDCIPEPSSTDVPTIMCGEHTVDLLNITRFLFLLRPTVLIVPTILQLPHTNEWEVTEQREP